MVLRYLTMSITTQRENRPAARARWRRETLGFESVVYPMARRTAFV